MKKTIKKSVAFGKVMVPPSKSYAHRLLIAGGLSNGKCIIENIDLNDDIKATLECLTELGVKYQFVDDKIIIEKNIAKTKPCFNNNLVLNCYESGSTLRFFIPIALSICEKITLTGTKKLLSRGLAVYEEIFQEQEIKYSKSLESITIEGKLKPGLFKVKGNISSQFITGLLFSLPMLHGDSIIEVIPPIESKNYLDITIDVLTKFGIDIKIEGNVYYIKGNQKYQNIDSVVEGDYSNASFLDAYNYFGGSVLLEGLKEKSIQGDQIYKKYFDDLNQGFCEIDLANAIDLGPILFCFASAKHGGHFVNTRRLRIKESDRVNDVMNELKKFGSRFEIKENEVIIYESCLKTPMEELDGHNDHRIVMGLCVLCSIYGGTIRGVEAVKKSFPTFFEKLVQLGIEVEDA